MTAVVLCDESPTDWARANGKAQEYDGPALLRAGLDALIEFYRGGYRRHDDTLSPAEQAYVNGDALRARLREALG